MTGIVAGLTPLKTVPSYELLLVGGAGGNTTNFCCGVAGAGSGAGGVRYFSAQAVTSPPFTVTVGAGGSNGANNPSSGTPSVFGALSASGGGYSWRVLAIGPPSTAGSGGGVTLFANSPIPTPGPYQSIGNSGGYSPAEGYPGSEIPGNVNGGWGGGGAGGPIPSLSTNGGNGVQYSITGTPTYYGGGGGAGRSGGYPSPVYPGGSGGLGGGGPGGLSGNDNGTPGTANTGGGGGGGAAMAPSGQGTPGNGGSGVIIVAYPAGLTQQLQVGPGLTYSVDTTSRPGKKIYTFTAGTGTCNWA